MKKHPLKIFFAALLFILPVHITKSDCGIGGRASKNYSFIHTDIIPYSTDYTPYLIGYGIIDNYLSLKRTTDSNTSDENVNEWRGRLCDFAKPEDVASVVYKATITDLADLRNAISGKDKDIIYALRDNTFAETLRKNGCTETIDYLIYAKECETHCTSASNQWTAVNNNSNINSNKKLTNNEKSFPRLQRMDQAEMVRLINDGRRAFRDCKAPFLKLRYTYQMMRLAHYLKDYKVVIELYDELTPKLIKINSIINYWIMAHKAGALKSLGYRAEAAYLFAVVFHYSTSKRQQAFISFDVRNEQEWQDCLKLCRVP